jgi:hypothetical protein
MVYHQSRKEVPIREVCSTFYSICPCLAMFQLDHIEEATTLRYNKL